MARPPRMLLGRKLPRELVGWRLRLRTPATVLASIEQLLREWGIEGTLQQAGALPLRATQSVAASTRVIGERDTLVRASIEAMDLLGDDAVGTILVDALAQAGVEPFEADGERFSPERHKAQRGVPASEPAQVGVIAETVYPGYRDNGRVVRLPLVSVYQEAPE